MAVPGMDGMPELEDKTNLWSLEQDRKVSGCHPPGPLCVGCQHFGFGS